MKTRWIRVLSFLVVFIGTQCKKDKNVKTDVSPPPTTPTPVPKKMVMRTLLSHLEIPWGLAVLPNGDLLFSERPGRINLLKKNDNTSTNLYSATVQSNGEGGLLSICLDPSFLSNHYVYAYVTTDSNRVIRFTYQNNQLQFDRVILGGIPQAQNHDGGALKFGPDGYLYVGTGDAMQPNLAQDKNSLAGKILRIDRQGAAAPGNPFQTRIWSYGHRNVQGFAWTQQGSLFATEHGPSGENGWSAHDEINLILPGHNYGWPLALGGTETDSLSPPFLHSGNDTWAPSGCTWLGPSSIWPNCLVLACLRGKKLIRLYIEPGTNQIAKRADTLVGTFNRLRNITENQDGSLIFGSSNRGSSGSELPGDDKIYQLSLE